jgi:membrane-associated HD superfamily phosphohydrolase
MWLLFTAIIVICLAASAIARRTIPKTYATFNAIAWMIEGVFWAIALVGLLYQCAGGKL